jgi:hypothetical protein
MHLVTLLPMSLFQHQHFLLVADELCFVGNGMNRSVDCACMVFIKAKLNVFCQSFAFEFCCEFRALNILILALYEWLLMQKLAIHDSRDTAIFRKLSCVYACSK